MKKYRFETSRLAVRDMTMDDCDIVAKSWGSPQVGKYLSDPYYKNGDELRAVFKNGELKNSENWTDEFYFVVVEKASGHIIGTGSTWNIEDKLWGIAYTIDYPYWNRGYGTEVIRGLEDFVRSNGGKYLSSEVAKENIGSLKVCYKNGFKDYGEISFKKSATDLVFKGLELRKEID